MSGACPRSVWAVLLLAVLAAGCLDFDADAYCAKNPRLCTLSVAELSPSAGPAAGGTEVTLLGAAIDPETVVEVGGVLAPTQVINETRLTFITPPHPSGRQDVVVRGRFDTVTLAQAFHYEPRPRVASFSPAYASSAGGKTFTLAGTDLGPGPTVFIGGQQVPSLSINAEATRISGLTPRLPPGTYDVEVRNTHGGVTVLAGALRVDVPWVEKRAGLLGGNVRALWVDPADASRVLAAVAGAGLYRSQDAGATWRPVEGLQGQTVESIVFSPEQGALFATGAEFILRSGDRGESWSPVARAVQSGGALVRAPDGTLLLRQSSSMLRLAPGASEWESLYVSMGEGIPHALAATAAGVFLGTSTGVYRLGSGMYPGWEPVWKGGAAVRSLVPVPEMAGSLYAGTSQGLYRLDPGQVPVLLNGGAEVLAVFPDSTRVGRLLRVTAAGLQLSEDSGVTWRPVAGLPAALATPTVAVSAGRVLVGTAGAGVFLGSPGQELTESNSGLACADVVSLAVDSSRAGHLYAGTTGGLFQSGDEGDGWTLVSRDVMPPPVEVVRVSGADARFVFAASGAGMRRSRDGGASWEVAGPQRRLWDLLVLPTVPPTVYAATDAGVQVSRDGGDTWADANLGLMTGVATRLAVAGPGPVFTLYATQRSALHALPPDSTQWIRGSALGLSPDPGPSPVAVASSGAVLAISPYGVYGGWADEGQLTRLSIAGRAVALLDAPEENAFVGSPQVLRRATMSPDAISGWTDISAGMTGTSIRTIAFHPTDSTRLYVGTEGFGVQVSTVRGF